MRQTALRWVIPSTRDSRRLSALMFVLALLVYLARVWVDHNLYYERGPFGLFVIPLCLVELALWCTLVIGLGWILVMSVIHSQHLAPAIIFSLTLFVVLQLPLPPRKPYPEEVIFADRRADFEQVVELAKWHQLQHNDSVGNPANYLLPIELIDLTENGLVFLYNLDYQPEHLSVEFRPTGFYYPIMYFENAEDVDSSEQCYRDGVLTKQLDKHWFLCRRDWN